ncbi:hypothetical protein P856_34 [Candidatus Endolissoclinum faulkneri L5]|uniref:NADH dehydrogenase [ubiquinone] 1 alpha subcomplex assembly factor 3 n=1 Tax=Candidatus Endolissoclinum faulkneri L5 TaxID=1401328 RepID=V9TVE3_9PROT|nr:Mth938-like domain-containing protein [Candidatus Endolissoclinum faulkneri]AHC73285.1 hypothetical protein P856_34 [Candidatus Endolissoclinum faulkneri L5]
MINVTPMLTDNMHIIHCCAEDKFTIKNTNYTGPILVSRENIQQWDIESDVLWSKFDLLTLAPVFAVEQKYDILLIGTGSRQVFFPPSLLWRIREQGPVAEVMSTDAACRTFSLLLAEGRRVAAALLPIGWLTKV